MLHKATQEVFDIRHSKQVIPYPSGMVIGHDALRDTRIVFKTDTISRSPLTVSHIQP